MNLLGSDPFSRSPSYLDEDILIRKLLLTHDPDGRRLDSELLLLLTEHIMHYATTSEVPVTSLVGNIVMHVHLQRVMGHVSGLHFGAVAMNESNVEELSSLEPLRQAIYEISIQLLCKCSSEGNLHMRTMVLFDMLGKYNWDEKMALVLAAFVISYGKFRLLMQLNPWHPLAASIAMLKRLPNDLRALKPRFKALSLLVKTMMDVTKCIIKFESLPLSHVELDQEISVAKSYIYVAAYWVIRSAFTCSSQITDLTPMKPEQVHSDSTVSATWELSSLVYRLSRICSCLRRQVDVCHQQLEKKIWEKLLSLFQEVPGDNQEVLDTLFASTNDLPLKDCSSQAKVGVSELNNKVVMLLISKPELLPIEKLLLLVQQTYDHPLNKKYKGSYEIVWVPIPSTNTWTDAEVRSFDLFSNSLPWYSIRLPWLLSSAVVNYVKQAWTYTGEPLMVVLDSKGMVSNSNAIDMVMIWGARAYPFSASGEKVLWEEENWTMQLMIGEIDTLLASWVEEGRNICIYGSENKEWIQELNSKLTEIKSAGVQLEMVYVGKRNLDEHVRNILASIPKENHTDSISFTKIQFFWLRLESMRRSKLRLGKSVDTDHILKEVSALLDFTDKGWAIIGKGSSTDIVKLQGKELVQCLNLFLSSQWGENVANLGFLDAIRGAPEPIPLTEPCSHSNVIPYAKGLLEGTAICEKCKHHMKKFVVFE